LEYNFDFEKVKGAVSDLMESAGGHGLDHVMRVLGFAMKIAETEPGADANVVALIALLHDVDDYKFGGTDDLANARRVMADAGIPDDVQAKVCEGTGQIGFGKRLAGVVPESIEAKIASDADMLDCGGRKGVERLYEFRPDVKLFDRNAVPQWDVAAEQYKKRSPDDTHVNHMIVKALRLKDMMLTGAGREAMEIQRVYFIGFLRGVFDASGAAEWNEMLGEHLGEDNVF
jgi:uncharacterized protein